MSLDEEQRAELREALAGNPSLRRLGELTRLVSAIAKHGRSLPPVALMQLPEGTALPELALAHLRFELHGEWVDGAGRTILDPLGDPLRRVEVLSEWLRFRFRGLERFRSDEPLCPTFEVTPSPDGVLSRLWVVGAELRYVGLVTVGTYEPEPSHPIFGPIFSPNNITFVRGESLVSNFDGPVVVTLLLDPLRLSGAKVTAP